MTRSRLILTLAACALGITTGGCFRAVQLERMSAEVFEVCPEIRAQKEISLSLGGATWGLIKTIAIAAEKDDPEVRAYVGCLDRVELVVYRARGINEDDVKPISKVVKDMLDEDWKLMVKSTDKDDLAWVHYRERKGKIREMQVTAYDGDEFVIVRLSGRLDDLFEAALEDHHNFTGKVRHAAID